MKIRNPVVVKLIGWLGAWFARWWMGSLRVRFHYLADNCHPAEGGRNGRFIYVIWHEYLLVPACHLSRTSVYVLVSRHADGQLLTEVGRHLRLKIVRGSSTRGGVEGLRGMIRAGRQMHLAVTPDGPKGPRRRVQPGTIYLASRTGIPIVPTGIGYDRPWRLRTWDRFALPRPESRIRFVTGAPIPIPPDLGRSELEYYQRLVQEQMDHVTRLAEECAETGRLRLDPVHHAA